MNVNELIIKLLHLPNQKQEVTPELLKEMGVDSIKGIEDNVAFIFEPDRWMTIIDEGKTVVLDRWQHEICIERDAMTEKGHVYIRKNLGGGR